MNMSKHTPGPWKNLSEGIVGFDPLVGLTLVATVSSENDAQMPFNARLITAAPEMYEALEDLLIELAPSYDSRKWPKSLVKAADLIVKIGVRQ